MKTLTEPPLLQPPPVLLDTRIMSLETTPFAGISFL